jgi:ketosteroid isomerase-like protein
MGGIRSVAAAAALAASCLGLLPQRASAGAPIEDATRAQIEQALRSVEQALARGNSAVSISKMMYAEDDMLAGEGQAGSTRGIAGTIKDFQEWIDSLGPAVRTCKFAIVGPVVASTTTFSSFVQLHCNANPPALVKDQDYRVIYVWRKQPDGWRVVLEMYLSGKF